MWCSFQKFLVLFFKSTGTLYISNFSDRLFQGDRSLDIDWYQSTGDTSHLDTPSTRTTHKFDKSQIDTARYIYQTNY